MNRELKISKKAFLILIFIIAAVCWPRSSQAQESREPLAKTEVVRLLENGVTPERVGALAKKYGIDFQVTEGTQLQLHDAGATDELIGMLKALAPSGSAPAPARVTPPPPEQPAKPAEPPRPKVFLLREGTEVKLRFAENLSSKNAKEGDPVSFVLADDIWVGDTLIVRAGAPAKGEVSHVEKAGLLGKPAELNVRLSYIKAGPSRVRLRGSKVKEAEGKSGTLGILLAPLGLLMPGKQIEVTEGTRLSAYVDEDVNLPAMQ